MMFNRFYNMEMMNTSASAPSANADSSCAHTARTSHTANTAMIAIMDAIIMASIIIFGLIMILDLRAIPFGRMNGSASSRYSSTISRLRRNLCCLSGMLAYF